MILIRAGQAWEIEQIALTHAQAHWSAYAPLFGEKARRLDPDEQRARWTQAFLNNDLVMVAVEDGRIVGIGHARADILEKLYLLASHRRRGLGAKMFWALLEAMRARGVATARFGVLEFNGAARRFYEAQGARLIEVAEIEGQDPAFKDALYAIDTARPAA